MRWLQAWLLGRPLLWVWNSAGGYRRVLHYDAEGHPFVWFYQDKPYYLEEWPYWTILWQPEGYGLRARSDTLPSGFQSVR